MRKHWVIFIARFAVAALAQFLLLMAPAVRPFVDGFSETLATLSASLIRLFGGSCVQTGAVLSTLNRGFAMQVLDGCNGVNVIILLWAAVVAFPAKWSWRAVGLLGGAVAIQVLNLLRLISLFYLGQFSRPVFEFAHLYLWETLIILDAMVVFVLWNRRVARPAAV